MKKILSKYAELRDNTEYILSISKRLTPNQHMIYLIQIDIYSAIIKDLEGISA